MIKNKYETLIYIYECFQKLNCDYIHYINGENFDDDIKKYNEFKFDSDGFKLISEDYDELNDFKLIDSINNYKNVLKMMGYKYNNIQEYKDIYEDKLKYIIKYLETKNISIYLNLGALIYPLDILNQTQISINRNLGENNYINTERRILDYILIDNFGLSDYLKFIDQFKQNKDYKNIIDLIIKPLFDNQNNG